MRDGRPWSSEFAGSLGSGRAYASPLALSFIFLGLTAWSWRKWPDAIVDFGRELYVPWQLASGQVLYTDIAHLYGPFSQYFNATLFAWLGTSYTTLILANLTLLAAFTSLLYTFINQATDGLTAAVSGAAFLSVFAFSQYIFVGNYNFVSPYAHEAAHGLMFSTLMLYALWRSSSKPSPIHLILAGISLGLVFLTKQDVFLAAGATVVCWVWIEVVLLGIDGARALRRTATVLLAAILPVVLFWAFLSFQTDPTQALRALGTPWRIAFGHDFLSLSFYRTSAGIDDPVASLGRMLLTAALFSAAILPLIGVCAISRRAHEPGARRVLLLLLLIGVVPPCFFLPWFLVGSVLPIIALFSLCASLALLWKRRRNRDKVSPDLTFMALWAAFALFLLSRILLNGRIHHYGFYLAMPSFLLLVVGLVFHLPRVVRRVCPAMPAIRPALVVIMMAGLGHFLVRANTFFAPKSHAIGDGGDAMLVYPPESDVRTAGLEAVLDFLSSHADEASTLVVVPEGIMVNYLTRRTNPTPHLNFMVPELTAFGEGAMLAALKERRPDYIVYFSKDPGEYGVERFGLHEDYGKRIWDWVVAEYESVFRFGEDPLHSDDFGVEIFRGRS
jgi:hypothetical protein